MATRRRPALIARDGDNVVGLCPDEITERLHIADIEDLGCERDW